MAANPAPNIPYSIYVPGGAPQNILSVAHFLSQFAMTLNEWIKLCANAVNSRWTTPPPHDNSPGVTGQMASDGTYLYICTGTNTWARTAIGGSW